MGERYLFAGDRLQQLGFHHSALPHLGVPEDTEPSLNVKTLCDLGLSSAGAGVVLVIRHLAFVIQVIIIAFFQMNNRDGFSHRRLCAFCQTPTRVQTVQCTSKETSPASVAEFSGR